MGHSVTGSTFVVLSVMSFRFQLVTRTSKQSVFPCMFTRTASVCYLPSFHCHFLFLSDRTSSANSYSPPANLHANLPSWVTCLPPPKPSVYTGIQQGHTIFWGLSLPTSQSNRISSIAWDSAHLRLQASGHLLATIF